MVTIIVFPEVKGTREDVPRVAIVVVFVATQHMIPPS